jgi:hypothetical protein
MHKRLAISCLLMGLLSLILLPSCFQENNNTAGSLPSKVSYNFHIRPILSDKCFKCHGPDPSHREAGLRLDIPDSAYAPLRVTKGAFALVPGKPEASELYKRVSSPDSSFMMPPPDSHLGVLSTYEVKLIKKWITQGARYEPHWAFTAPAHPEPPHPRDEKKWIRNDIDAFVLDKMEQVGLEPNEEADKERLLKRVSLDLTGLPPSLEMMDKFEKDNAPDAYEKIVDELLASPAYGEKMAIHWLDIARYADSYGYQDDNIRTQWPWRDWVIHAFNENMPYDQFLTWQIAGDMLPDASKEQILATGFFRNHKYTEEGGVIPEEYRIEYLIDKTKTYGKGILGITIECAQCHDHKYDPFTQKEYYQLLAFFNNTKEVGFEGDVGASKPAKNPILSISSEDRKNILSFLNYKDTSTLMVSVMGELDTVRKTYLLNRGVYDQPGPEVKAEAPHQILPYDTTRLPRNRLGLASWTVDKRNPLTSRVFVNQMWQQIFGRGIVKTSGDFGMQGDLPTHPALLDWLATDFMDHKWDIKRLLKEIVMSATYRQSSKLSEKKMQTDPENIYLSRAPRVRVEAETIRDIVLASSGLLNKEIGGPSVKPYQPKGIWEAATSGRGVLATYKQDHGKSLYRRGLYTFIKLTVPPPSLIMFDASNRDQCQVERLKTNTPLQALVMMNDPIVLEAARVLAEKLLQQNGDPAQNIQKAFRMVLCRKPTEKETQILNSYYQEQWQLFKAGQLSSDTTLNQGEYQQIAVTDKEKAAALMKTIDAMYNLEETITKS